MAEPVMLGERLRTKRYELGLLQREVAKRIGVSRDTIRNWEAGRTKPAVRYLPRLAEFLGESPFGSPSETDDFPARLTFARRLLGFTQRELAHQLGVDETTIGSWERGKHRPIGRHQERMNELLELPRPSGAGRSALPGAGAIHHPGDS